MSAAQRATRGPGIAFKRISEEHEHRAYGMRKILAVTVTAISLTSCAMGPIGLDMRYPAGAAKESDVPVSQSCAIKIDNIVDMRLNKQSMGHIGTLPVYGEDVESWLRRALSDLQVFGYRVGDEGMSLRPVVRMNVNINQAYVHNVLTSIESAVRLTVHYKRVDGSTIERAYRGSYIRTNWASGAGEIMGTLNHAVIRIVRDIAKDLSQMCVA